MRSRLIAKMISQIAKNYRVLWLVLALLVGVFISWRLDSVLSYRPGSQILVTREVLQEGTAFRLSGFELQAGDRWQDLTASGEAVSEPHVPWLSEMILARTMDKGEILRFSDLRKKEASGSVSDHRKSQTKASVRKRVQIWVE